MTEPHAKFVLKALTYVSIRAPIGAVGMSGVCATCKFQPTGGYHPSILGNRCSEPFKFQIFLFFDLVFTNWPPVRLKPLWGP